MADTISSGRWVIDFVNLRVYRDTSVTATVVDFVNDLYSDIQDYMDDAPNMDDTVPMSAQTPTEYSIINQWFIDDHSVKYLKTGAIQTNGWESAPGASGNKYILAVRYDGSGAGSGFVASDIGKTVTDVSGDTGELLYYDERYGAEQGVMYIRPDDPTYGTGDMFEVAGAYTTSGGTGAGNTVDFSGSTDASGYGEQLWANIFSLGTLVDYVRCYVIQGNRGIAGGASDSAKIGSDTRQGPYFWPASIGLNADGHIDVLIKVRESLNVPYTGLTERDRGYISVFARRGGSLYDHYEADLSSGGRNPIPLSTGEDNLNDEIGHHSLAFSGGSGATLLVGELFQRNSPNTETAGIIAAVTGAGAATGTIDYFLVRGQTQFADTQACTAIESGKTFTVNGTPTDLTPVTDSGVTVTHGAFTRDINNGNGSRPYSIDVNCNSLSFARVYRRFKYITRGGSNTSIDGDDGQEYTGSSLQIEYNTQTAAFTEGLVVTGSTSLARGIIVADHDDGATGDLIIRNVNGTFQAAELITDTGGGSATVGSLRVISTPKASPLGTLAGGRLFGAPGVAFVIASLGTGEGSNYQLIDDNGVTQIPPTTVTVSVTGVVSGDRVAVFRTSSLGGPINKAEYESHNANNAAGDSTFETSGATIGNMHPTAGWIRVPYDQTNLLEDRYYYTSYATTIWTLDSIPDATVTTADPLGLTLTATAADFVVDGVLPGMMVRNTSDGNSIGVVDTVTDGDNLVLERRLAGGSNNDFGIGDVVQINKLVRTYDNTDDVYVPFIDQKATSTTVSTSIIYVADRDVVVRVRRGGTILPFEQTGTITSSNFSVQAVRTLDTIAT